MASIKLKGDTSGEVTIQAPSVAGTNTLTLPATSSTLATQNSLGVRNLIINGDMRINQRGNYSTTVNGTGVFYSVDRWLGRGKASAGVFNILANSSLGEQPDRFTNHVVLDVTTASTPTSNDSYSFQQFIEGYNISKLNWGTSAAKSITLSFWAKSTLTGTFGGSVANGDYNRFNPFSYTISAANTWEYKTVTITGDTSGSWSTTNGNSMRVIFSIGAGSGRLGTAGTWTSSVLEGVTGQTNHIATNGSNLRITGVQIEEGTSATPFEHLQFGQQLALCQRYYEKSYDINTAPATNATKGLELVAGTTDGNQNFYQTVRFAVPKRANPSINFYKSDGTANTWRYDRSGASNQSGTPSVGDNGDSSFYMRIPSTGATWVVATMDGHWTANAEL